MRVQGWDPVLITCQIISLQAIHYLALSLLLPPLLAFFAHAPQLAHSGGALTVGHVLDWREMAARPTVPRWAQRAAEAGGLSSANGWMRGDELWDHGVDERRGWVLGLAWMMVCAIDIIPLYTLIRRPTHILDFSLTLLFIHVVITTYTAGAFPQSMFFWVVCALGALVSITVAEQLCVKREMSTDISTSYPGYERPANFAGHGLGLGPTGGYDTGYPVKGVGGGEEEGIPLQERERERGGPSASASANDGAR